MYFDIDKSPQNVDIPTTPIEAVDPHSGVDKNVGETSNNVENTISWEQATYFAFYGEANFVPGLEPDLGVDSVKVSHELIGMYTKALNKQAKVETAEGSESINRTRLQALLEDQGAYLMEIKQFLEGVLADEEIEDGLVRYCKGHLQGVERVITEQKEKQKFNRMEIAKSTEVHIADKKIEMEVPTIALKNAQEKAEIAAEKATEYFSESVKNDPQKLKAAVDEIQAPFAPEIKKNKEIIFNGKALLEAMEKCNNSVLVSMNPSSLTVEDLEGPFGDDYQEALEAVNQVRVLGIEGDVKNLCIFLSLEKRVNVIHALAEYETLLTDLEIEDESDELSKVRNSRNAAFEAGATEPEVIAVEAGLGKNFGELDSEIGAREVLEETTHEILSALPSPDSVTDQNFRQHLQDINTVYQNIVNYGPKAEELLSSEEIEKARDLHVKVEKLQDFRDLYASFQSILKDLTKNWSNRKMIKVTKRMDRPNFTELFAEYEIFVELLAKMGQKYYGDVSLESLWQTLEIPEEFQKELEEANSDYKNIIEKAERVLEKYQAFLPHVEAIEATEEL